MYAPIVTPTSTAATISLVFGILSWFGLILIGPIVAIIAGHMARNEIRHRARLTKAYGPASLVMAKCASKYDPKTHEMKEGPALSGTR